MQTSEAPFEVDVTAGRGHMVADVKILRKLDPAELKILKESILGEIVAEWAGNDPDIGGTTCQINFMGLDAEGRAFFRDRQNSIEGAGNEQFSEDGDKFSIDYFVEGYGDVPAASNPLGALFRQSLRFMRARTGSIVGSGPAEYDVVVTLEFSISAPSEAEARRKVLEFYSILGGSPVVDIDVSLTEE